MASNRLFPAVSSRPRKTVRWELVEIAASRTEEGDREFLCNYCLDGKSIRQCERVLTLCRRPADHPRWVETHLRQGLPRAGGYHDALACFWSARTGIAVTGVALVIAIGEPRRKFSQVALSDWLTAQRTERLRAGCPAIH